jgi:hypothetical protein
LAAAEAHRPSAGDHAAVGDIRPVRAADGPPPGPDTGDVEGSSLNFTAAVANLQRSSVRGRTSRRASVAGAGRAEIAPMTAPASAGNDRALTRSRRHAPALPQKNSTQYEAAND